MTRWVHMMSSYRGQWIPGDRRGFRSRGHRVHSSGDYRRPPPEDEHAGLRRHVLGIMDEPVRLSPEQVAILVRSLGEKLEAMDVAVAILAADATHCHALFNAGDRAPRVLFGRAKQFASHRLRIEVPGKLWGASSGGREVRTQEHFVDALGYIADHGRRGAFVWINDRFAALLGHRAPGGSAPRRG
ncbi:MAG: hypothetical protein FJ255_09625 [Phycisphaerae bacterium]|nr:hypothetical protein [Phycisphaerae bacterium]